MGHVALFKAACSTECTVVTIMEYVVGTEDQAMGCD